MRNWLISTEPKQLEYYKDILIHADTGVHEQAYNYLLARGQKQGWCLFFVLEKPAS